MNSQKAFPATLDKAHAKSAAIRLCLDRDLDPFECVECPEDFDIGDYADHGYRSYGVANWNTERWITVLCEVQAAFDALQAARAVEFTLSRELVVSEGEYAGSSPMYCLRELESLKPDEGPTFVIQNRISTVLFYAVGGDTVTEAWAWFCEMFAEHPKRCDWEIIPYDQFTPPKGDSP